jgi:site-specific DNA recombinase
MKHYFGYVRVSTPKQGEHGVSLQEQKGAIEEYTRRHNLSVTGWYEETETAAKRGRRIFEKMLRDRSRKNISGVIVHKIDRSARNFFDWAGLNALMDEGVEIHIASENRRIETRGDRLAADVQAVVAVDYIRNLREETIKGFYGRLKQGLYPLKAPLGYLDRGRGKVKEIDPMKGPLIRSAFERYATGAFTLTSLSERLAVEGLRSRNGKPLSANILWKTLRNPFYMGIMRIEKRGEHFPGIHEPLVSKRLFDEVEAVLDGRETEFLVASIRFSFVGSSRVADAEDLLLERPRRGGSTTAATLGVAFECVFGRMLWRQSSRKRSHLSPSRRRRKKLSLSPSSD